MLKSLAILVLLPITSIGEIVFVDVNAPGQDENGQTWCDAYKNLQDATLFAQAGDVIRVAQGVYHPDIGLLPTRGDRTASFRLRSSITIEGGYAGSSAPIPDARDPAAYETILSGDLLRNDVEVAVQELLDHPSRADNSYNVVIATSVSPSAVLSGFVIEGGNANGQCCTDNRGGGLHTSEASPTIIGCHFRTNAAGDGGGAIYSVASRSTHLSRCLFSRNYASVGAGVATAFGEATISECKFVNNHAEYAGGGVSSVFSNLVFQGVTLISNEARYGGGYANNRGSPTIHSSLISRNTAEEGGGIYNDGAAEEGTLAIWNSTIAGNMAFLGAGLMATGTNTESYLDSCILWGNTSMTSPNQVKMNSGTMAISFSAVQGGWSGDGMGNIDLFPEFRSPDGHDGIPGTDDDDWRLAPGSPCINTGSRDLGTGLDLDGHPRVLCGRVDMGAYEFGIGDYDCNQAINLNDFNNWPACRTEPYVEQPTEDCRAFDFDGDQDIDLEDFASWQALLTL